MQVFLPYFNLSESIRCLDKSRMGNQVWREAKTLINGGWKNHPAAKMWADYKPALAEYCLYGLEELFRRGWIRPEKVAPLEEYFYGIIERYGAVELPWWMTDREHFDRVVESHRLNLLFKDPVYYSAFGWGSVPTSKPDYYWPVKSRKLAVSSF